MVFGILFSYGNQYNLGTNIVGAVTVFCVISIICNVVVSGCQRDSTALSLRVFTTREMTIGMIMIQTTSTAFLWMGARCQSDF